ncbi:Histidine--tRNA ligase [Candidatus Zixiibacteriota bacterium]|nr:Histidine--tRNA ligase [candidate division Zixibacteria bacterium]
MAEKRLLKKVEPKVLKGFRDYPPEEEIARQKLIETARRIYERHGFLPLQTPALEYAETLLGGDYTSDNLKELFGFHGPDEVDMALRYEFTVSLARYVAGNPELALPFRRYQYGTVWRVDKPGPGRYREFMQCDFDMVGTSSMLADAEIIAVMVEVMSELGIKNFIVKYSNRKILNGLAQHAAIPADKVTDVFRVIDKLEKQGEEAVRLELGPGRIDKSGDRIPGLNLENGQIETVLDFLNIAASHRNDSLDEAEKVLDKIEIARSGIDELREVQNYLNEMQVPDDKTKVDLTIVRGLGYYTGPVYETTLLDLPDYGSVFSGGRYDNLIERFSNKSVPATGSSFGVDRMLAALIELRAITLRRATSDVLVTTMDKSRLNDYIAIVNEIRAAGINAELFLGETKNLNKQLKYADRVGIPLAVIAGSDEFESGMVTIKDLRAGAEIARGLSDREEWLRAENIQTTIKRPDMISFLRNLLK